MEERTKLKKDETRKCGSGGTDGRARGERNQEGHTRFRDRLLAGIQSQEVLDAVKQESKTCISIIFNSVVLLKRCLN